jgi:hypothetical protein
MTTSQEKVVLSVCELISEEKVNCFKWLFSSVNIITKENSVGFWRVSSILEQSKKVVVLAMDVATDFDGGIKLKKDGLVDEDVSRLNTEPSNFIFSQLNKFARPKSIQRLERGSMRFL